jgi:gluconolactonase
MANHETVGRIERLDKRFDALIPPGTAIEKIADGIDWAEGPLWDSRNAMLLFSDIPRNGIFSVRPGSPVTLVLHPSGYTKEQEFAGREPGSNGLTFDAQGRLVICQHGDRRVVRREENGTFTVLADRYQGKRLNSPNDLVFRSNGDLYFTDPPYGLPGVFVDAEKELPFQGVFRLTADGTLTVLVTDLRAPNGIALSPDEKTLYVSNAQSTKPIWMAYDVRSDGSIGPGRQFAEARAFVRPRDGVPDGMKVDEKGNVFATGPGGVHVFAPDGSRLGRLETGVPTANVNWGEDGSVLYVAANHWILRVKTTTRGRLLKR